MSTEKAAINFTNEQASAGWAGTTVKALSLKACHLGSDAVKSLELQKPWPSTEYKNPKSRKIRRKIGAKNIGKNIDQKPEQKIGFFLYIFFLFFAYFLDFWVFVFCGWPRLFASLEATTS